MKKIFSTLLLTAAVLFTMTACLEEETSAIDVTGTATIKGTVFVNNDVTPDSDGNERASDATVRVSYDAGHLDINGDGDSKPVVLETTTDAQGAFSFEVPTNANGIQFTLTVDDYETTYTYYDAGEDENVSRPVVYSSKTTGFFVKTGETVVERIDLTGFSYFD